MAGHGPAVPDPGDAMAADIAIAVPLSGPFEALGRQAEAGIRQGFGDAKEPLVSDTLCSADGGKEAAESALAEGVRVMTGFLCTEALQAAIPALKDKQIPVLALGNRTPAIARLAERNKVRLRTYGYHRTPGVAAFLEIKQRVNDRVRKVRQQITDFHEGHLDPDTWTFDNPAHRDAFLRLRERHRLRRPGLHSRGLLLPRRDVHGKLVCGSVSAARGRFPAAGHLFPGGLPAGRGLLHTRRRWCGSL